MLELNVNEGVARLVLSHAPVNALSPALIKDFHGVLDGLQARDDWQVLVIASALPVYSAGGDLQTMLGWLQGAAPERQLSEYVSSVQVLFQRIESLPQITIAEIDGAALGGGLEMGLACDMRFASTPATLGLPEVRLGLLPAAGGTQRLTRLCGQAAASRLILCAEIVDAATALGFGLVNQVWPREEFKERSAAQARRSASLPRQAQQSAKSCIVTALTGDHAAGYRREIETISALGALPETAPRIAAFLDRAGKARK
ncbi:MAG: enoyl-CoA hydratase/isomerase family protein [Burkholderiaceae bacterium]|nr:enoyl-CoA hydratase/isomerase family protein [Burkholderiaceae bacterium]